MLLLGVTLPQMQDPTFRTISKLAANPKQNESNTSVITFMLHLLLSPLGFPTQGNSENGSPEQNQKHYCSQEN